MGSAACQSRRCQRGQPATFNGRHRAGIYALVLEMRSIKVIG